MHRLAIGPRLIVAFGTMIAILVLVAAITVANLTRTMDANQANLHSFEVDESVEDIAMALEEMAGAWLAFVATADERFVAEYQEERQHLRSAIGAARELTADDAAQQRRLREFEREVNAWIEQHMESGIERRRAVGELTAEDMDTVTTAIHDMQNAMSGLLATMEDIEQHERDLLDQRIATMEHLETRTMAVLIGGTVAGAVLGLLVALLITRSITRPMQRAVDVTNRIADGDLTVDCSTNATDETGHLLNAVARMNERLRTVMEQITDSASQLGSASEQLSMTSAQTRTGTEQQRDQTAQVATAMNEMTSTVQEVARNTQQTSDAAKDARAKSDEARNVVDASSQAINKLAGEVGEAAEVIRHLEQQGENIGEVLTVIRSIAEQTNLLALNAAIEAARAGDHGRGFAVVADEVRSLAHNTQSSIGKIDEIIEELQRNTRQATEVMNRGTESAEQNVTESQKTADALENISAAVTVITDMADQVASAIEEQTSVAEDINKNVTSISEVAGDTADSVKETAGASEDLARLASELKELVGTFRLR